MKDVTLLELDEMLKPPSEEEVGQALARFAAEVRRHYGDRLKDIYLFGSRARREHGPESDADIAVVLEAGDWVEWIERHELVRLAYQPSLETGLAIQPWPVSDHQWSQSDRGSARWVASARRDAVPLK